MTGPDRQTFVFHASWYEMLAEMPDELRAPVTGAIIEYAFTGKVPDDPIIRAITALVRITIDRDKEKWNETRKKRSDAARARYKGAAKSAGTPKETGCSSPAAACVSDTEAACVALTSGHTPSSDEKGGNVGNVVGNGPDKRDGAVAAAPRGLSSPPSREMVIEYFKFNDFGSDPLAFHAYYSANGWRIGSNRIRDWTSAAYNWEIRQKTFDTNHLRNETQQKDKHRRHRGVDTAAVGAEDYTGMI